MCAERNGFQEDSWDSGGYRCLSVLVGVGGATGTIRFHVRPLLQIYRKTDPVYEMARRLGLLAGGVKTEGEDRGTDTDTPLPLLFITQGMRLVACAVAAFFAVKYFLLYHWFQAVALSLPHAVTAWLLLWSFWQELRGRLCGGRFALRRCKLGVVTILYRRYLGVMGRYFPWKVAGIQALEVALQAIGKLGSLGAMATFVQFHTAKQVEVAAAYWMFLGLLVVNSIYPPLLFLEAFQQSPTFRVTLCLVDGALGLGYMVTYLCTILVVLPDMNWDVSCTWYTGSGGEWYVMCNGVQQMSPTIAFPTTLSGYLSIYWPAMRAFAMCRALESMSFTRRPEASSPGRRRRVVRWLALPCYSLAMLGFLVSALTLKRLVSVIAITQGLCEAFRAPRPLRFCHVAATATPCKSRISTAFLAGVLGDPRNGSSSAAVLRGTCLSR